MKEELFQKLEQLWETFAEEHAKTTKKSDKEARKALGEIKKLVTPYRKASVDADKN